ncbi:unnamed protein product [Linum trigynum]|uniref:C2H2-type domain-containing protein n=1 Tax=Linum trigynum TaxID=586398 RepID=A0AAV2G2Z7_9ROSI
MAANNADADAAPPPPPPEVFRCGGCPREFPTAWDRMMHERDDHHQGFYDVSPWCNLCGIVIEDDHGVVSHQQNGDTSCQKKYNANFTCVYCKRAFCVMDKLNEHYRRRHAWQYARRF